jgi:hypothetical protein
VSAPVYYAEEAARHPDLVRIWLARDEAQELVIRTVRHFRGRSASLPEIQLRGSVARGGRWLVRLPTARPISGLLVAHEVGHHLDSWARERNGLILGERWHGKRHRRIVDRICRWLRREGLESALLACAGKRETVERVEAKARAAACPPPLDARIAHRQAQVERLERRIRILSTRLRTAKRSLSALLRSQSRRETSA